MIAPTYPPDAELPTFPNLKAISARGIDWALVVRVSAVYSSRLEITILVIEAPGRALADLLDSSDAAERRSTTGSGTWFQADWLRQGVGNAKSPAHVSLHEKLTRRHQRIVRYWVVPVAEAGDLVVSVDVGELLGQTPDSRDRTLTGTFDGGEIRRCASSATPLW